VGRSAEERATAAPEAVVHDRGQWGDIVSVERVYSTLPVLGLAAPDAAGAKATATFTFSVKGSAGLKLSLGIATFGATATYTLEEGLELEGTSGQSTIASFLLPVNRVTQLYLPDDASEWFERQRYELVMIDPVAPNIGARADAVAKDDVLSRKHPPRTQIGGGSAPVSQKVSTTRELEITAEIALPLSSVEDGPSLTLSASVSGSVAIEVAYELPANVSYQQYWLAPIAGACFVPA